MHRTTNNWKRLSSCLLAAAVCAATWFTPALALPAGTQPREDGPAVSFDFESDELTGAALRGAAKVEDGALVLDGAKGSYLDVEIPDALKSGDSMTISMWVKLDSIGHDTTLMTMGQNQANYAIFVVKNVFNHLRFAMKENGGAEDNIEAAPYPEEGKWSHVAFVQDGANGRLYKDGAEIASSSSLGVRLSSLLAQGGAYIHLGTADVWDDTPVNGRIDDFQIWAGALSAEEIAAQAGADKNPPDLRDVEAAAAALTIEGDLANVTADLALPLSWENGVAISWKSNSPDVITDGGVVSRKASDRTVTLTATLTKGAYSKIKLFIVTVKALELDPFGTDLSYARRSLDFILNNGQTTLPQSGPNGAVIRWEVASGRAEIDADNLVHKADGAAENEPVVLRATVELDGQSESFLYENLILKDRFTGFLMSYFDSSNDTGGIRLGYSYDGVNWIPLKGGEPVVKAEIGTRRLRDPNIFRRKDGTFGIVATQGWDNPEIYAWDTNDLITFTNERLLRIQGVTDEQWAINREKYNFSVCNDEAGSPPGGGSAWAPEAIYDPVVGKYLIYWSDTHSNGGVHAPMMANWTEDFTNETLSDPFILLDDPHNQMIDANIVKENGTYFMTFKNDYRATPGEGSVKKMFEGAVATELGENSFTYQPGALITDMQGNDIEGATTFRNFNDNNLWYMYFDPLSGSPDLAYAVSPALTGPEANWVTHWAYGTPNYKVNSRINHVTVLPVTQSELDALVAAHGVTGLQYQVLDVREPEGVVSVGSGTPLGLLMPLLPATLPVQLDDGGWYDFPVTWSSSDYDPAAQGSYTFAGALSLPDTVNPASAPQNLTATVVVDSSPAASVTSVEVAPPAKLVYDLGEPLSLDGGYLVVHYADGRSGRLPLADEAVSISGFDNSAAVSELTVTAGYSGFTAPFTVSVVAPASITLTPPAKLDYVLGQKLDLAGGSITVHYEDSSRDKTIPLTESGVRIEGFPTQAGDGQLVTVIYGGQRATFAVNVREVAQDELGAVLHYDFNQATDSAVENQVSDAYRGSLKNGASVADGALRLGGGTQYLDVPTGAIADLTGEEVSLSMWVNLSSNENNQTILTVGRDKNDFAVWVTNVLRYGINADGRGEAKADSSQAVPIHRWTHLALVQTGDTVTLYQDGVAVVSRATYRLQEIMKDGSFIRLGGAGVWPDPYTNGSVDDFKVFARALDAQQVEADRLSSYLSLPTWIEAAVQKADSVPVGDQVGEYPAEAVAAYREAIEAAQDALDAGSEPAMQAALDSLKAAGKALDDAQITEPAVDKTALKDLIEAAGQYEEGAYTAASWAALEAALEEANRVMEDKDATAEEVQTASDELQAAIDGLRYELNTELLEMSIELAEKTLTDFNLTEESEAELQAVIDEAKALLENPKATQTDINEMFEKVIKTLAGIVEAESADKAMLNELIAQAEALNRGNYTPSTLAALDEALEAARAVSADETAEEAEVKAAQKALMQAIIDLKFMAQKDSLKAAYKLAEELTADEKYEEATLAELKGLMEEAAELLEDPEAEQAEVDAMGEKLTIAMAKVRLAQAVAEAKALKAEAYTEASWSAVESALKAAEEVLENGDAEKAEYEEQAVLLRAAMNALVEADAPKPVKPSKGGSTSQVSDSDYWAEVVEKINGTEKGGKVNAKLDEGANVPATVIDALKNKGVTVVFEIGGKDYAVNGAGELKGYSAAAVYYTSEEVKAMAGTVPAASGNAPAANSNPETGGEVPAAVAPAAPEAVVPAAPVAPEVPAVIEPAVPAEAEAPAAQAEAPVEAAEAGMPVWAIAAIVIAAAILGGTALVVIRRKRDNR